MAGKKSKKFVAATEGKTIDKRVITREQIQQMAKNYNVATYRSGVNIEHIRYYGNFGVVDTAEAIDNAEGKAQLWLTITGSDDLVTMNGNMKKLFTSVEIDPNFVDKGEAYLVGLAVTDNPASLGVGMLTFSAENPAANPLNARKQRPENYFTAAEETTFEFVEPEAPKGPSFIEKFRSIFDKKAATDEGRFSTLEQAITEVAEHGQAQSTGTARQFQQVDERANATNQSVVELTARLTALEGKFSTTPVVTTARPPAAGNTRAVTHC
jgi:hypothetical protein